MSNSIQTYHIENEYIQLYPVNIENDQNTVQSTVKAKYRELRSHIMSKVTSRKKTSFIDKCSIHQQKRKKKKYCAQ
jgi:hypothetical protein